MKTKTSISTHIIQLLSPNQAWHYQVIPFQKEDGLLHCYFFSTEKKENTQRALTLLTGLEISLHDIGKEQGQSLLSSYYRKQNGLSKNTKKLDPQHQDFLWQLIEEAKGLGSSDIHIEPFENNGRIRIRIDGLLIERYQINKKDYPALVNQIKIKANLDIAEKRLPQDGRIFEMVNNKDRLDIRVSVLPTLHGEKMVLRLLHQNAEKIDLENLGLDSHNLALVKTAIQKPHGMILVSGPTGSGKTTTLYSILKILNQGSQNILTIEDPIEYTLEGINQSALREDIGFNFEKAMRTFLRQDPDIIMVGEIRDQATADMAIRASLTGHLILSTIHTNSAWGVVPRLVDMGIESYLLADTLVLSIAQRLVPLLCTHCKTKKEFNPSKELKNRIHCTTHYVATGCTECHQTGYIGRSGIFEIIPIDEQLRDHIKTQSFSVKELLQQKKISSLSDQAIRLFEKGKTSLEAISPILLSDY